MKKIIATVILAMAVALGAHAQPKAIGGRFSGFGATGIEFSYQHYVGSPNFIEINAGGNWIPGIGAGVTGTYNFTVAQPSWTPRGEWGVYVGPGVYTGFQYMGRGCDVYVGAVAQVGLEFKFWFPLQLSVDLRPQFGIDIDTYYDSVYYHTLGLLGFAPSLSVRYAF